jgi:hypothetical protein
VTDGELFDVSGSGVAEPIVAVFATVAVEVEAIPALMVKEAEAPTASDARVQLTVVPSVHDPDGTEAAVAVSPAGMRSATVTAVATDGPSFVTTMAYVTDWPGTAGVGVAVLVARRSACVVSVVVTVLSLFVLFESGTAELIVALFESTVPVAMPAGAMTVMVLVTGPVPAVFVARVQLIVPATFEQPDGSDTTVSPAGSGSVTDTLVASDGPAFPIENV